MKKYRITAKIITISSGIVGLNNDQADPRMFNLRKTGTDRYEVLRPVFFKKDNVISYDGDLPVSMAKKIGDDSNPVKVKNSREAVDHSGADL